MINTSLEPTFPLAKAARKHASARGNGSLNPSTLHRWRFPGIGGIRLECIKIGGVWHTSEQALQRFFEKLTAAKEGPGAHQAAPVERPAKRERAEGYQTAVEAQLDAVLGVAAPPRNVPTVKQNPPTGSSADSG